MQNEAFRTVMTRASGPRQAGTRSLLGWLIEAFSLLGLAAAGALLTRGAHGVRLDVGSLVILLPLGLSASALVLSFFAERMLHYYLAFAVRVLTALLALSSTAGVPLAAYILTGGVLVEIACFEPYPLNLGECLAAAGAAFAVCLAFAAGSGEPAARAERLLPLLLFGVLVSLFGCHMTRFREMVVKLRRDKERITNFVVQLMRASSSYQDFAVRAHEHATEKERQRITRDIHDVVGYTLTNNIMLLEAAMDLMQENPLALPTILETARTNAEEGLGRIRSSMYQLRGQETAYPRGIEAIHRLARVFEQATSIRVRCEFANIPWTFSERVDSTLYHLVQECLVNSFRHAQATEVRVVFWFEGGTVRVSIGDDGAGATAVAEGIGIKGMRERVENLGGTLRVSPGPHGFTVSAVIPAAEAEGEI